MPGYLTPSGETLTDDRFGSKAGVGYFFAGERSFFAAGCVIDEGSLAGKLSSSASSICHSSCFGSPGLGCGGRRVPLIFGAGGSDFLRGMAVPWLWSNQWDSFRYRPFLSKTSVDPGDNDVPGRVIRSISASPLIHPRKRALP